MSDPTHAQQTAILADLCDAIDPTVAEDARDVVLDRINTCGHLDFAVAGALSLGLMLTTGIAEQFGRHAAARVMAQVRNACASVPDIRP